MYYLETQNLVHCDISYTKILLRSQGKDSPEKKDKRREIMEELGLSEIESLRDSLGCRKGLLIDFDYASLLVEPETKTGQADASDVNESQGKSQGKSQGESQSSIQSSHQGSSQVSGQGNSGEDFEVVDNDDNSNTVILPIDNTQKSSGRRTVSYF